MGSFKTLYYKPTCLHGPLFKALRFIPGLVLRGGGEVGEERRAFPPARTMIVQPGSSLPRDDLLLQPALRPGKAQVEKNH